MKRKESEVSYIFIYTCGDAGSQESMGLGFGILI